MDTQVFTYTNSDAAALETLQEQLIAAHALRRAPVGLDIDGLPSLDAGAIRGLITLLRRVRDAGAEVVLHVTRGDLRRTLSVTALDRVFTIAGTPA